MLGSEGAKPLPSRIIRILVGIYVLQPIKMATGYSLRKIHLWEMNQAHPSRSVSWALWMPPDLWLGDLEPTVCGKLFKKCDLLWPWHSLLPFLGNKLHPYLQGFYPPLPSPCWRATWAATFFIKSLVPEIAWHLCGALNYTAHFIYMLGFDL